MKNDSCLNGELGKREGKRWILLECVESEISTVAARNNPLAMEEEEDVKWASFPLEDPSFLPPAVTLIVSTI